MIFLHVFLLLCFVSNVLCQSHTLRNSQESHKSQPLSNEDIRHLSSMTDKNHINRVLDNILKPRVVGTPNHSKVFKYIKNELKSLNWNIEIDEFDEQTPNFGKLRFKNIIATLNPNAERFLVLACHYDSKYFPKGPQGDFVGATDSAVPCAMMLNLAKVMHNELSSIKDRTDVSLKLVFFDGEEAFVNWGPTDSIYGARHLAQLYEDRKNLLKSGENVSELQKIDLLVLLDLIGHKGARFSSNFADTEKWYLELCDAEDKLKELNLLKKNGRGVYFKRRRYHGLIEDDHVPFLRRNVPILHLISTPFPNEWHTPEDNRSIVDLDATEDINKVLRIFVAQYLHVLVTKPVL